MHQPIGAVSEVVGVATLPSHRRRGWAGRVTQTLVADAREMGVSTVFLSAADESVASVYRRVGFRQVGLVCAAEAE
jgi:predicted GNAT family acetyltransferase